VSCQLFCFTRLRAGDARHAFEPRQLPSKPCRPRWTLVEYHPVRYRTKSLTNACAPGERAGVILCSCNKNGAALASESRAVIMLPSILLARLRAVGTTSLPSPL